MPDQNWDLFFNQLFQGYLRSAASLSAGVPATEACPILISQDKEEATQPRIQITHERRPETSEQVYDALFTVTACILDDTTEGTTQTQAETWLQKIRQRLNKDDLLTYITTLSTDDKTGWQPAVLHTMPLPLKRERDEDAGQLRLSFDFTFTVIVATR